jgi:kynurenine formamidase
MEGRYDSGMRLIDLSQPIYHECPNCPVHPPVRVEYGATHPKDGWQLELLTIASHTGSHVDAPLHKIAGGASLDDVPLDRFVGPAVIVDLRGIGPETPITEQHLAPKLDLALRDMIVLLNTGWGEKRARDETWHYRSPYLSPAGAQWLVERGINGVGIDHYSIGGSADPDNALTHEILLGAGVWVVEDLRFPPEALAAPRPATLWCLPINMRGFSGTFCRPVLAVE